MTWFNEITEKVSLTCKYGTKAIFPKDLLFLMLFLLHPFQSSLTNHKISVSSAASAITDIKSLSQVCHLPLAGVGRREIVIKPLVSCS